MTIVELMVAMVIGLFLLGGMLQVFSSSRLTYRVHEATSRMQETGRMALEVIARDVRMADFWGCASDLANVTNNLDSAGAGYLDFGTGGLAGTEGGPGLPDRVVLRGGFDAGIGIEPPYGPQASADVKVPAGSGLSQGDVILISDCTAADIFQITNANPNGSGQLVHNTGSTIAPGNYNATNPGCPGSNAHCLSKVYGADASVFRMQEIVYSIGPGTRGEPALFRNGDEFLDGVEDLQILYGEDTDLRGTPGFGTPNYYVPADQVIDMESVISLRFAVVVRSYQDHLNKSAAQNFAVLAEARAAPDSRIRQVYTSTVNIRNRL